MNETSSAGVWNTTMTTGGVLFYKCMTSNTIGTEMSRGVFVIVNGKRFQSLRQKCPSLNFAAALNKPFKYKRGRF